VHWPATAHSGELMVREMEGPTAEPVVVVINLPPDEEAAETVAEQAFGTLVALIDRGTSVFLTTLEWSGRCTGAVGDRRSAGRRLARAIAPGDSTASGPRDATTATGDARNAAEVGVAGVIVTMAAVGEAHRR
jgi:uncharacterized protein (DUF58 family)